MPVSDKIDKIIAEISEILDKHGCSMEEVSFVATRLSLLAIESQIYSCIEEHCGTVGKALHDFREQKKRKN